jgi:hypothetical protein
MVGTPVIGICMPAVPEGDSDSLQIVRLNLSSTATALNPRTIDLALAEEDLT